ncbi:MAG: HlyD family efflux transporter periplasmic adaptor subunit [Bacteroidales bacterium]|nr:HlyD family efflux transporter periplasmic adaptor subunit [Candidatus Cacconaster caballi]
MKRTYILLAAIAVLAVSCRSEMEFDACGQINVTTVTLSAESSGKLLEFNVTEGTKVEAGTEIGLIDTVQVSLQIAELQQRIAGSSSRLVDVKRQSKADESQLISLQNELQRYTSLLASNAATQKQVDDIKDKITILKDKMEAQEQSWERGNQSVQSEKSTYAIQLAQKLDQLSKCHITAPISGTVLTKYVEAGESVTNGKALLKIADLESTYVRAYFTTAQLAGLKLGDTLTVIPDDGTEKPEEYKGTLTWISDQAEFTPKNIQTRDERADLVYATKVSVPNDGTLRLGMYAYIRK